MRFDYLNLEAFGHFTNFNIEFDEDKNFHILYGPNEAGKSTILRAVSNFLYGFPQRTADSFLHDNPKLRIGGQLRNKEGQTLEFFRRKGNQKTMLDLENQPINEAEIEKFLNGLQEQQFLNMFALDHIRLREGGESLLESDGNVGESIFAAASGISVLRNVLEELENTSRKLYLKSGSKPPINQALREEKELTRKMNENQLKAQSWKQLEREYVDGEKEIEAIKQLFQKLGTEEMKYRRLKQTLPKIALRREVMEKQEKLAAVPELKEDAEETRKATVANKEAAETKQNETMTKIADIDQQLEALSIPEGLLQQEAVIEGLNREVDGYQKNREALPALKGEHQLLEQQVLSTLKELDPTNTSVTAVEKYRISVAQKKEINDLADRYPLLMQAEKTAKKEVVNAKKDLEAQEEKLAEIGEVVDSSSLENTLNQVKNEGNLEQQLAEKAQLLSEYNRDIHSSVSRLSLWEGTIEELKELQVPPLKNTIMKYKQEHEELAGKLKQVEQKLVSERETIQANEGRMQELESGVTIPTEQVLQKLRSYRDQGWLVIRNKLNQDPVKDEDLQAFTKGLPLDLAFEKSISEADETADLMRHEAKKLGEKNKLTVDLATSKQKLTELEAEKATTEKALDTWQESWEAEWQAATIIPLSPDEMLEWLEHYEAIINLISEKEKLDEEIAKLTTKRDEMVTTLRSALTSLTTLAEEMTFVQLMEEAEKTLRILQDKNNSRVHVQKAMQDAKMKLDSALEFEEEVMDDIDSWNAEWNRALEGVSFSSHIKPEVVKTLIERYDACLRDYDKLKQKEDQLERTENEINLFHEKVKALDHQLLHVTDEQAVDVIVTQVYHALNKAKQDKIKQENLYGQKEAFQREQQTAVRAIKEAETTLNELMEAADCTTLEELEKVEAAFNEKKEYTEKIVELEEELVEVGDGLSLNQLLEESKDVDIHTIDNKLDELAREKAELDQTRSEIEQRHGVVKDEYNQKIAGTNDASVKAAEEKESVLAKISDLTDEYVNHKLAALLLKRGIDYYREQNQSPIMNRASELFAKLTQYSFDGMTVDFDEKDEPVMMGLRNGEEKVLVSGMSDGTTDQLYLALRIASIEKYVSENEPIPFIVDDILIHFDDERAKETLQVLLELSEKTQVIFFTHHKRLLELMKQVAPEHTFQQTELQRGGSYAI